MADSMSRTSRLRLMLVLLLSLVGCDQASKCYAVTHWSHLKNQAPLSYFHDTFRITYAENKGAFLSLFGEMPETTRYAILVVGNSVFMIGLAIWLLGLPKLDRWSSVAWTLVFVGGVGNLIDRVRINAVIDFLNLGIGPVRTGIFNVADMAITSGFFMIAPLLFRRDLTEDSSSGSAPGTVPAPTPTGSPS